MAATLDKDADGNLIRKAGVMSIVISEGDVRPGDAIRVELPDRAAPAIAAGVASAPQVLQRSCKNLVACDSNSRPLLRA